MKYLFLWLALFPFALAAATPKCLLRFASVSDSDPDGAQLTAATYDQLLATLGSQITPDTWRAMAEGKDPFAVPEQGEIDLSALRQRLKQLRQMLKKKGWDTPERRELLVQQLTKRAEGLAGAVPAGLGRKNG